MSKETSSLRFTNPPSLPKAMGYSHIVEITAGQIIYISGQVPLNADGVLVGEGDLRAQTQQVFRNLQAALRAVGLDFRAVAKLGFFVTDISQIAVVREVRDQYVDRQNPPASTAVEVSRLVREGMFIEVDAIAVK